MKSEEADPQSGVAYKPQTPMLKQYGDMKAVRPDALLAMRVGDFYEFYGNDAEIAAEALGITLTGREDGSNGRVPMAGVPYHAVERYLAKLISLGYKVALCDQLEDPKSAKGLVRRGITRVLTPATVLEDSMFASSASNFLAGIAVHGNSVGFAVLESSTGDFFTTDVDTANAENAILQQIGRFRPSELLVGEGAEEFGVAAQSICSATVTRFKMTTPARSQSLLLEMLQAATLASFGLDGHPSAIVAAAALAQYACSNGVSLQHLSSVGYFSVDEGLQIDLATRRALELTSNLSDGGSCRTLFEVLDRSVTRMGSRLIKKWIDHPLTDKVELAARHDAVERLAGSTIHRQDVRAALKPHPDLHRLITRICNRLATPHDLESLRNSLFAIPSLAEPLLKLGVGRIQEIREAIGAHSEVHDLLKRAIVKDPPQNLREGGVIAEGYDAELDKLRDSSKNAKSYIAGLELAERKRSGIHNLRVGYNAVFGYYLEVSKANSGKVPDDYVRKQTTAGAERYITTELKDQEAKVLGADERSLSVEEELFKSVVARIAEHAASLRKTGDAIAELDALAAFAEVAISADYRKPEIVDEDVLEIESGRHPTVEVSETEGKRFVPNDLKLGQPDQKSPRCMVLTGPNMAGKSTYLRQTALIVLMAQIGSFVPARSCRLGICDHIFARIGARDDLVAGRSTFMVEMVEAANIVNNATESALIILDEIGRGTSTFDGLAIAWSILEHLAAVGAKTLFATHYYQLNAVADEISSVRNFRLTVEEVGDDIVWTHRVAPGGTDKSYGLHVAKRAGLPASVISRAKDVLSSLEAGSEQPRAMASVKHLQLSLFELEPPVVLDELRGLDVNRLTPIEALRLLDDWKRRFGESS